MTMVNVFVRGPSGVSYARKFASRVRAEWFIGQALRADCCVWSDLWPEG